MCICVYIRASSHLIDRHDRQTDIDTLTDRQTHIRMYRHADRWSDQTDEHTYGHADRWTYKTEGNANRWTDQMEGHTYGRTDMKTDVQTCRRMYRYTDRWTDQTDGHTNIHTER